MLPSLQYGVVGMNPRGAPGVSGRTIGSQSERGTSSTSAPAPPPPSFVRATSKLRDQTQTQARFFPHLGPAPISMNLLAIQGREQQPQTARQPSRLQPTAATLPNQLAAVISVADSGFNSSAPPTANTTHAYLVRKSTTVQPAIKKSNTARRRTNPNPKPQVDVPEEKVATPQQPVTIDTGATTEDEGMAAIDVLPPSQPDAPFRRVSIDPGMPSPSRLQIGRHHSISNAIQPAQGPPAHVRRVSVNIHDVLESPRLRQHPSATVPSPGSAGTGNLTRKPSLMSPSNRHGAISRTDMDNPSNAPEVQKPCSVLMCSIPRIPHEGYCAAHLADFRAGLKLNHKRSGSVLQRMLNPTAHKPANAGGYGAARAAHTSSKDKKGPVMHHAGIGRKHGLADIDHYEMLGITEGDEGLEARQAANRRRKELEREKAEKMSTTTSYTPVRKNSKTLLADVVAAAAAAVAKANMDDEIDVAEPTDDTTDGGDGSDAPPGAPDANKFFTRNPSQRRFSMSKPASNSSDWLHTPQAQAARLLRIASKPKLPKTTEKERIHSRKISYGLPVEPLPSVDMSLAQLPFQRFYFSLPTSLDAFINFRDRVSTTPEGASVCLVIALLIWSAGKEEKEREELRKSLGIRSVDDEDSSGNDASKLASLMLACGQDEKDQYSLPLHVINSNGRRNLDTFVKPLNTPRGNGAPTSRPIARLQSFHKSPVHEKKLTFKKTDRTQIQPDPAAAAAAPSGEVLILRDEESKEPGSTSGPSTAGPFTMDHRWQALISCIHPDQTIEFKRSGHGAEASVSFRNRCLCAIDVETLNDSFDTCPHLARSYVLGTSPKDHFTLPSSIPPLTPPQDKRKLKFAASSTSQPQQPGSPKDAISQYWENQHIQEVDEYKTCLSHMCEGSGPLVIRMARHPFASGTAQQTLATPFALTMIHNSGLRYPKSIKLRKDQSGHWRCIHWFNLLVEVPLDDGEP